jgi:8-oxo-dGTP pyrophosphatase MutT (NUDIX family)
MSIGAEFIRQAGAIPVRDGQVCLVTSSNGKRWVIPKGLIDPGHTAGEATLQEAWEEAGLVGLLSREPVGSYLYAKWGGTCHVTVFLMQVTEAAENWPERSVRQRRWVSPAEALALLEDEGLREVLRGALADNAGAGAGPPDSPAPPGPKA